jgi:uncharacterized repeat protein (TIGR04138 family)
MEIDLPIECDLPCERCGYNLRTRRVNQVCPECGSDVLTSVCLRLGEFPALAEIKRELRRQRFSAAAEAAGCTIDALMFVSDALFLAMWLAQSAGQKVRHVSAAQLCAAIRSYARNYFNDDAEAIDLLDEWGIRSSEAVGRMVFAMVEARLLQAQESDSIEQFRGLFTLDRLFK